MNKETTDQIAAVMLQHGTPDQQEEAMLYCSRPMRRNLDDQEAPYPGMAAAFEAHTGQSWTDRDWRAETATWAAAWEAALLHNAM
jgi:hypothetical protein